MLVELYSLVSAMALVGYLTRVWIGSTDVLEVSQIMNTNLWYRAVAIHTVFPFTLLVTKALLRFWINPWSRNRQWQNSEAVITIAQQFLLADFFSDISNVSNLYALTWVGILCFTVSCFHGRIKEFPLELRHPELWQHRRLIIGEVTVLVASIMSAVKYTTRAWCTPRGNTFMWFLGMMSAQTTVSSLSCLLLHFLYLSDGHYGNSPSTYQKEVILSTTTEILERIFSIVRWTYHCLYRSVVPGWIFIIQSVIAIFNKIQHVRKARQLLARCREIFDVPTEADLERDPICILCRDVMTASNSRKFPCGHCLHVTCLERWIGQKLKCPMCQFDLSNVSLESKPAVQVESDVDVDECREEEEDDVLSVERLIAEVDACAEELKEIKDELMRLRPIDE